MGALLPWGSRQKAILQADSSARKEGQPCENGNTATAPKECCEGFTCTQQGPGNVHHCEESGSTGAGNKKKPCEKNKDCDTKHDETCTCQQEVLVKKNLSLRKDEEGTECERRLAASSAS